MNQTTKNCPVCSGVRVRHISDLDMSSSFNIPLPTFSLYKCRDCGFIMSLPLPNKEMLDNVYGSAFYSTTQQHLDINEIKKDKDKVSKFVVYKMP